MRYQNLQVEILQIFAEAAHPPSAMSMRKRVRVGIVRAPMREVARIVQKVGRLPILTICFKCGLGITSEDPRIVQGHVNRCGVKSKHVPQRK